MSQSMTIVEKRGDRTEPYGGLLVIVASSNPPVHSDTSLPFGNPDFQPFHEIERKIGQLNFLRQSCLPHLSICLAEIKECSNCALKELGLEPIHNKLGQL